MRKSWILIVAAGITLWLLSCQPPVQEVKIADADERSAEVIELIVQAKATGDFSGLEAVLAEDDPDGELRGILEEHGVFAAPADAKQAVGVNLPPFYGDEYQNGDVLVSRGSSLGTSIIMDLVLVKGYGHAGVLNKELAGIGGIGCVLSADIDYLIEPETGKVSGLTYQTYGEWCANNDIVTVLCASSVGGDIAEGISNIASISPGTIYAFLGYPGAVVGAFQPIPKSDNDYWYCSKAPWRVYNEVGVDVEAEGFYDYRWQVFRSSLLYKVYVFYLRLQGYRWWQAIRAANVHLQSVLEELVMPDELRADGDLVKQFTVTGDGIFGPGFDDWSFVGW